MKQVFFNQICVLQANKAYFHNSTLQGSEWVRINTVYLLTYDVWNLRKDGTTTIPWHHHTCWWARWAKMAREPRGPRAARAAPVPGGPGPSCNKQIRHCYTHCALAHFSDEQIKQNIQCTQEANRAVPMRTLRSRNAGLTKKPIGTKRKGKFVHHNAG